MAAFSLAVEPLEKLRCQAKRAAEQATKKGLASGLPRLPAAELESAVLDQLRAILRAPNLLGDMLPQAIKLDPTLDEAKITVAMTRLDAIWDQLFPAEQTRIVKLLVEKVIVSPNDLEVRLRANGIERLVLELRPEPVEQQVEALA